MSARSATDAVFDLAAPYLAIDLFAASSREINWGAKRLEAGFYGSHGYRALRAMEKSGFNMSSVKDLAKVIWPGVFRRVYVEDRAAGVPFLTTSGMLMAHLEPKRWTSSVLTDRLEDVIVDEGMILVSRSGTVGNTVIATSDYTGAAVTEDALRVVVKDDSFRSVVWAFLQSDAGQFLLTRSKSGSVVEHLYEADVSNLPIPHLPKKLRKEITRLVDAASGLRVESNRYIDETDEEIKSKFNPDGNEIQENSECEISARNSKELYTRYEGQPRIRLDATFQGGAARLAEEVVRKAGAWARLYEVVEAIPFTGPGSMPGVPKVDAEVGTPTVTGRDLRLARPRPSYYLMAGSESIACKLQPVRGTTLIMCAGTLGSTDYVRGNYEEWFVSLDVVRVIPNHKKLHSGYVFAFLTSSLGQAQLLRHKYGSVIPRIHSRQVAEVCIPMPADKGKSIGEKVDKAFDKRAEARRYEDEAIQLITGAIESGRRETEAEWGAEY